MCQEEGWFYDADAMACFDCGANLFWLVPLLNAIVVASGQRFVLSWVPSFAQTAQRHYVGAGTRMAEGTFTQVVDFFASRGLMQEDLGRRLHGATLKARSQMHQREKSVESD